MSNEQADESHPQGPDAAWDRAVSERLARLRAMPIDLSHLEAGIVAQIPRAARFRQKSLAIGWRRAVRGVAASFAVLAMLGVIFLGLWEGPVLASSEQMAQMHDDLVSGRAAAVRVDSIDAANKALSANWPRSPEVPDVPYEHVMACCMKDVKGKRVACVLMQGGGTPVTMTIANAADMKLPKSPTVARNGVTYHVQSIRGLSMVMTQRNGRWVCMIGQVPPEKLMSIADRIQF